MALIFVGTYTSKGSEGIYVYSVDPHNGALELVSVATGVQEPSFLALSPGTNHLYAVNELKEYRDDSAGGVRTLCRTGRSARWSAQDVLSALVYGSAYSTG